MIHAQQRKPTPVIFFPLRAEIPRAEISKKDLRLMIKHLEVAIQASQNTLDLVANNLAGMRDFVETEAPVPITSKQPKDYHFENVFHYAAVAAAVLLLFLIVVNTFQPVETKARYRAHVTRTHNS